MRSEGGREGGIQVDRKVFHEFFYKVTGTQSIPLCTFCTLSNYCNVHNCPHLFLSVRNARPSHTQQHLNTDPVPRYTTRQPKTQF